MKRLFIMDVKVGETACGIACGPCGGELVIEVKFRDEEGTVMFFSFTEAGGIPCAFITDKSTFDKQLAEDPDDQEFIDYMDDHATDISDYEEIFSEPDEDWFDAYRYVIHIMESDDNEIKSFIRQTVGKWLDECDIPVSHAEEEFMEENEE